MTCKETATLLREQDGILILTHKRPDGDTLGSTAALCLGLVGCGGSAGSTSASTPKDYAQIIHDAREADFNEAFMTVSPNAEGEGFVAVDGFSADYTEPGQLDSYENMIFVSAKTKSVEACLRWIDYFYTNEGAMLWHYGPEGVAYTKVGSKCHSCKFGICTIDIFKVNTTSPSITNIVSICYINRDVFRSKRTNDIPLVIGFGHAPISKIL